MPESERATTSRSLGGPSLRGAWVTLAGLAAVACASPVREPSASPASPVPPRAAAVEASVEPLLDSRREWLLLPAGLGGATSSARLLRIADFAERSLTGLPAAPRLDHFAFSPDGAWLLFTHRAEAAAELWLAEVATGTVRRLAERPLELADGIAPQWWPDGSVILAALRVEGEPAGHRSQLARVWLDGRVAPLGKPGPISRFEPSPDGGFLLVEFADAPIEVWDRLGNLVRRLGVRGPGASSPGPRSFTWRADAPATLAWVETSTGDEIHLLGAPFGGEAILLTALEGRVESIAWASGDLALVTEREPAAGRERIWRVAPERPGLAPELLLERSLDERASESTGFLMRPDSRGRPLLETAGGSAVYLVGKGPAGGCPALERLDIATRERRHLLSGEGSPCDRPVAFLDPAGRSLLVRREVAQGLGRYFARDLETGEARPLPF